MNKEVIRFKVDEFNVTVRRAAEISEEENQKRLARFTEWSVRLTAADLIKHVAEEYSEADRM